MKNRSAGFTLVELAIVLVIIGLLMGGILKGQELITGAKVKAMANDFKAVATAYYGYVERFRSVAGDDTSSNTHVGTTAAGTPATTLGDGKIQGTWNSTTTTDESYLFWQQVRKAGLLSGNTDAATASNYVPTNSDGGRIGITSVVGSSGVTDTTFMGTFYVCSGGITARIARQLDYTLDDGATNAGNLRVGSSADGSVQTLTAASEASNATYTVCIAY